MSDITRLDLAAVDGDRRPRAPERATLVVPAAGPATGHTAGRPPGLTGTTTLGALVRALGRQWPVAVPVGLVLGAVAAAGVWAARPEKSTSYTLLRMASAEDRVLRDSTRVDYDTSYTRTQLALMRSRTVLRSALQDERVRQLAILQKQPDAVEWLERELRAEVIDGTDIVRVSLTSRGDTADLAPVLNAVMVAYLKVAVESEQSAQRQHLAELQKVYNTAAENVRRGQEAIRGLTRALNGGDSQVLSLKQQTMLQEYAALRREQAAVNTRLRNLDVLMASLRSRLAGAPSPGPVKGGDGLDPAVELEVDVDPRVQAAEAEVVRLKDQMARLSDLAQAGTVATLRDQITARLARAEADLVAARQTRRTVIASRRQAAGRVTLAGQLQEAVVESAMLVQQRDALQKEVDDIRQESNRLGNSSTELDLRRAELGQSEAFLKSVWDQKERLAVELSAVVRERVKVIAPAEEATVLNRYGRVQEAAVGGLGGLLAGLLAVALWDQRRGRIHSTADVATGLRLSVMGSLPMLPDGRPNTQLLAADPADVVGAELAEAADGIRTKLIHDHPGERGVVLMVASPSPGEGKSTLVASLAASFARSGRRTLLVDGDLRCPTLHTIFELSAGPGLCEVLTGNARAEAAIRPTGLLNLDLLPAGVFDPAAVAGLARPAAGRLFASLRERYDYVFVDSSPLLSVPDGFMVARCADGVLFSVRPGLSQAADVYAGYEQARDHRLTFAGVVLNGLARPRRYYRGYDRRYDRRPAALPADVDVPLDAAPND